MGNKWVCLRHGSCADSACILNFCRIVLAIRGARSLPLPDYVLGFYIFAFFTEIVQLVLSSVYLEEARADEPSEAVNGIQILDIISIVHALMLAVFAVPACIDIATTFRDCSCACGRVKDDATRFSLLGATAGGVKMTASAGPLNAMSAGKAEYIAAAEATTSPEEAASCCSRATFWWMNPLMILGWQRPLESEDIPPLAQSDLSHVLARNFMKAWRGQMDKGYAANGHRWLTEMDVSEGGYIGWSKGDEEGKDDDFPKLLPETGKGNPSLGWSFVYAFGRPGYFAAMLKALYDIINISVGPNVLHALITYLQDYADGTETRAWVGYAYVGVLAGFSLLGTLILHQYFLRMFRLGQHLRSATILAAYRKALKLSTRARQAKSVGQIVNVMSTDATRMQNTTSYLMMLWSAPLQITLTLYYLWQQIGPALFAGLGVMVLSIPLNAWVARTIKRYQTVLMKKRDKRVNATSEAVNGMKIIKLSAWESHFLGKIVSVRAEEVAALTSWALIQQATTVLWVGMPLLVSVSAFATYVGTGHQLTAAKAFTAISLFSLLRFPLAMLPMSINNLVEATVSARRIKSFLLAEELDPNACLRLPKDDEQLKRVLQGLPAKPSAPQFPPTSPVGGLATPPPKGYGALPPTPNSAADTSVPVHSESVDVTDVADPSDLPQVNAPFTTAVATHRAQLEEFAMDSAVGIVDGSFQWRAPKVSAVEDGTPTGSTAKPPPVDGKAPLLAQYNPLDLGAGDGATASTNFKGARLDNINLQVKTGEFMCIVGKVGSGKSSLLAALLAEMPRAMGTVWLRGSVAYVPQTAFVLNDTVRGNILFGLPFDEARYAEVLRVCQLEADIAILPAGDLCEIGDKGINLSGGQRQRVALARAVYADADVYIFDDPLSAVDAHVGRAIFNECMLKMLAKTTRILVTHGLQYTRRTDRVLVMAGGSMAEQGTYAELLAAGGRFTQLLRQYDADVTTTGAAAGEDAEAAEDTVPDAEAPSSSAVKRGSPSKAASSPAKGGATNDGKLTQSEGRERGKVSAGVYAKYAEAGGGTVVLLCLLSMYALSSVGNLMANWYISYWTDHVNELTTTERNLQYLYVYIGISVAALVVMTILRVFVAVFGVRAAKTLHDRLLHAVFHAKQSFFDTVPVGRILNRFSNDTYQIDEQLAATCSSLAMMSFNTLGTFGIIASVTPWFVAIIVPLMVVYYYIQQYYVSTSRELQRLNSVSKSPIYSNFGQTIVGATSIRAYQHEDRFVALNDHLTNVNQASYFAFTSANRWLAVRLETIGTVIVVASALLTVVAAGTISASAAGLSVSYALSITQGLNWLVRMAGQVETQIVSVERVDEYSDLNLEPSGTGPDDGDAAPRGTIDPPSNWPETGAITLKDFKMKYRHNTPYVLHGINAAVAGGEKVGICGRTGAGKSSLVSALFRLADVQEGTICIDGIDIKKVSLNRLRSTLSIIPQEPWLFQGSLRSNLDPTLQAADDAMWKALAAVSLESAVKKAGGLDASVAEGGENWSQGQRQLICVARALLRGSKVVVLDEASSSVDVSSDAILQNTIRTQLANCTVLTIAHRLNTIVDADKILVLDAGRVAEFDSPAKLTGDSTSAFSQLLAQAKAASEETG